jgi:hypothetical protein
MSDDSPVANDFAVRTDPGGVFKMDSQLLVRRMTGEDEKNGREKE